MFSPERFFQLILFLSPFSLKEGAEKQAQLERAMREKAAVEQELEKVSKKMCKK